MTALAVHWWTARQPWQAASGEGDARDRSCPPAMPTPRLVPGVLPTARLFAGALPALAPADVPVVIGVRGNGDRIRARERIRAALRETIARMYGLAPAQVEIISAPGRAPLVAFRAGGARAPGIGISHDGPLSLAAINPAGPVGIDLMQVRDVPDWQAVARDYLGPNLAVALDDLAPGARALAFVHAWTEHEARLKCLGLQLEEWSAKAAGRLAGCCCTALALPPGFAGTVATR